LTLQICLRQCRSVSNLALYIVTVAVWGTTWIAIEFQLGVVAPEVSVFYRYVLASLLLFAWCRARGLNLKFELGAHKASCFSACCFFV
ncbi:MAG: hypothetical protein OEY72_12570, partial [Gammaproteobacteria bacterium]|nr:hypothetical protein [Gammaproteobacteria bacterium]